MKLEKKKNKPGATLLISDKRNFEIKTVTREKDWHYIMSKGTQEETAIINKYAAHC